MGTRTYGTGGGGAAGTARWQTGVAVVLGWLTLVCVFLGVLSGCSHEANNDQEFLLVFSGDCKSYLEPCG